MLYNERGISCALLSYIAVLFEFSGDKIGLPRPVAFLDPSMNEDVILENGVNYASGGGGILNETGGYFVSLIIIFICINK